MSQESTEAFEGEWICLQNQYDSYEKFSLIIKLTSVLVCSALLFHNALDFIIVLLCLVLWLVDSVWKTFQSRIGARLLDIEHALANNTKNGAYQYNTQWIQNRPSASKLLREYIVNGLAPTVVAPHALIVVIASLGALL